MKKFLCAFLLVTGCLLFTPRVHGQSPTPAPPEIIYPQNSTFCTDFEFGYEQETSTGSVTPNPGRERELGGQDEKVSGDFSLDKIELPDFSVMDKNLTSALEKLLPQELKEQVNIENKALSSEAKHFVSGKTKDDKDTVPIKPSKTNLTLSVWWSNLLGQTKIMCGLFGTCQAPKSMEIKIADTTQTVKDDAYKNKCSIIGNDFNPKTQEQITSENEFQTSSYFTRTMNTSTGIIKESSNFSDKTRGQVAGGASFQTFSDFQRAFIPQELMEEWEIKTGAGIDQALFYTNVKNKTGQYDKPLYYGDMEKEKFKRCISLCTIYPSGFDISAIDPMCTSCNPNDYKIDYIEVDKTNCHPIGGEGCDYKSDDTTPRCDGDPICESGKCYHNMYRMNNDYTDRGCPLPYNASGCTLREICVPMTFKKNPSGGYGPCQYTNTNVCVRADWKDTGTGMCDYLCNWACCKYQN